MIPKVTILDIYKKVFKRSSLITIPNISDLLEVPGSPFTRWEVFCEIVQNALDIFNKYNPLNINQKIYLNPNLYYECEIRDNFKTAIMEPGKIPEDSIVLMPTSINGISLLPIMRRSRLMKNFAYSHGKMTGIYFPPAVYYCACTCDYPLIEDYDPVTKLPTDKCAVYYLPSEGSDYTMFINQVYVCFCNYLENIKDNNPIPDMPLDLFGGIQNSSQQVQSLLDNYYESAALANAALLL